MLMYKPRNVNQVYIMKGFESIYHCLSMLPTVKSQNINMLSMFVIIILYKNKNLEYVGPIGLYIMRKD